MAKDHFAYIGAHRKCFDEIERLKKEMWKIIMDSKAEMHDRVQATKELHSLSKTSILFLRDLPFVANLSKLYDENTLNSIYDDSLQSRKNDCSNTNNQEFVKDASLVKDIDRPKNLDNSFDSNYISGGKTFVSESEVKADNSPNKHKYLDDKVFEDMQRQMHITDHLKGKSMEEITNEDLDGIITPEHKESIRKIEELLDD